MNTRKLLLPALLVCMALACSLTGGSGLGGGVPGSGNIQTETRELGTFEAIVIEYPAADIVVQQDDKETIEIKADDNLLPQLSTEVISGKLTLKSMETDWKAMVNPSKLVKISITVKELNELILSAPVGEMEVNGLQADSLRLVLSGGAQINLNDLQVDLLDSVLSGAGNIQANGTAEEIKLILSGLGNFNAADLKSKEATVELSGMGDAMVQVQEELTATLSGAGSIKYFGHPHVEQNITGAGSVKPAE